MQATRQAQSAHRGLSAVLALALLAALSVPAHAESLRARLQRLFTRQEQVRSNLREIKRVQRSASQRLGDAERDLEAVESRLRAARRQLEDTRAELEQTRADLRRLQASLERHTQDVQAHVLALYRAGDTSYLHVVLRADSFADFANRERYIAAVVNQDKYVFNRLETLQRECDAKRALLERQERRRAALLSQIAEDQARAAERRRQIQRLLADAESKRAAAEEMLAAMEAEQRALQEMVRARARGGGPMYAGTWSGSLLQPVPGRLTSGFGWRMHPILHRRKFHQGVDLACAYGTPIRAADKGLVICAGWRGAVSGNTIIIDHGSGVQTAYCHLSAIQVSEGDLVTRGQVIGEVGSTGRSTGPHLHFGVLKDGEWVNPLGFTR